MIMSDAYMIYALMTWDFVFTYSLTFNCLHVEWPISSRVADLGLYARKVLLML